MLARLLGRLRAAADGGRSSAEGGRSGTSDRLVATDDGRGMPYERRLIRLSRLFSVSTDGVLSLSANAEDIALVRFAVLLRIVIEDGMSSPRAVLGDPFGVVLLGAGSFDRAEWTLSSIFCILPMSPLI